MCSKKICLGWYLKLIEATKQRLFFLFYIFVILRDFKELSERSADEIIDLQKINDNLNFVRAKLDKYRKQLEDFEVKYRSERVH